MVITLQLLAGVLYCISLPEKSYTVSGEYQICLTFVNVIFLPTALIIIRGDAPLYSAGVSLLLLLGFFKKKTILISTFTNILITVLSYTSLSAFAILEVISMLYTTLPIRFLRCNTRSSKQLASMFLLNSVMYVVLVLVLVCTCFLSGTYHVGMASHLTAKLVAVYAIFKFGSVAFNSLKIPAYELLPVETIVYLTSLTLLLVPVIVLHVTVQSLFTSVPLVSILVSNSMCFGQLTRAKTIPTLLLYTTVVSNLFALVSCVA